MVSHNFPAPTPPGNYRWPGGVCTEPGRCCVPNRKLHVACLVLANSCCGARMVRLCFDVILLYLVFSLFALSSPFISLKKVMPLLVSIYVYVKQTYKQKLGPGHVAACAAHGAARSGFWFYGFRFSVFVSGKESAKTAEPSRAAP